MLPKTNNMFLTRSPKILKVPVPADAVEEIAQAVPAAQNVAEEGTHAAEKTKEQASDAVVEIFKTSLSVPA